MRNKGFVHQENPGQSSSGQILSRKRDRPAPAAVPAGSASCAGSEVHRTVGLDMESDGIQAALFNWGVSYITQRIETLHYY